ncbi:SdpI family protein [Rummeliibacillus sp. POC4]|nr:SdpI family protein [Rummeliibacillus sp. POC4]RIJ66358.1 SdpI family protein [Rummeliibacillus sp. POC4]
MSTISINVGISILIGAIFIISGFILLYKPPKDINPIYGYRTKRSMNNMTLWKEGNTYSAKLLIKYGIAYLVVGAIISFIITKDEYALLINLILMILVTILLFVSVEKRLKKLSSESHEKFLG